MNNLSFQETVRLRHSCRSFLSQPVDDDLLLDVLADAQRSPSNCNTQPWNVHIVSGEALGTLSKKLREAYLNGDYAPDFSFDLDDYTGIHKERQFAQGKAYYEGLGVGRGDKAGRDAANLKNYSFFNAPHVALLFMPNVGDNVRVAADLGMYAQTFLLSLTAHGLAGIPQTVLGFYANLVRQHLGIASDLSMLLVFHLATPIRTIPLTTSGWTGHR